jgi:hypothetical protein
VIPITADRRPALYIPLSARGRSHSKRLANRSAGPRLGCLGIPGRGAFIWQRLTSMHSGGLPIENLHSGVGCYARAYPACTRPEGRLPPSSPFLLSRIQARGYNFLSLFTGLFVMGVTEHLDRERRERLHELLVNAEILIAEAECRIESHQRLWRFVAADPLQCRLHLELEHSLIEGLTLLYRKRAICLHELGDSKIPRHIAALSCDHQYELLDKLRYARLSRTIAWLDGLAHTAPLRNVIMDQRERAVRELWEVQKRQLQRTGEPFPNSIADGDIGELDDADPDGAHENPVSQSKVMGAACACADMDFVGQQARRP